MKKFIVFKNFCSFAAFSFLLLSSAIHTFHFYWHDEGSWKPKIKSITSLVYRDIHFIQSVENSNFFLSKYRRTFGQNLGHDWSWGKYVVKLNPLKSWSSIVRIHLIGATAIFLHVMMPFAVTRLLPCHCATRLEDVLRSTDNFSHTFFFGLSCSSGEPVS